VACLALDLSAGLPAPAWPTSWLDQKHVRASVTRHRYATSVTFTQAGADADRALWKEHHNATDGNGVYTSEPRTTGFAGGAIEMNGRRAVAATLAVLIVAGAGCSGSVARRSARRLASSAAAAQASPCLPARAVRRSGPGRWPSRIVLRESAVEAIASQVVDPAAGAVFLLASTTNTPVRGPWVLCRISLATGAVRLGPTYPAGGLTIASGYLWAYSAAGARAQPVVSQVSPVTLDRIRSIRLPAVPASFGGAPVAVTAGPAGTVWIGSDRTLLRVSVSTGTLLTRVTLPQGMAGGDLAVSPAGTTLYVSAGSGAAGGVILEYNARSGRKLAAASSGVIRYSVAGADLTAVPGGVWASFRTGMLGLTIHLGANGLPMITPPGSRIMRTPPTSVFHWPMYETTSYGGGALWVANELVIVACLDPRTGAIRASEHLPVSQFISGFDAIDPAAHTIFALHYGALLQITPPRRCWT
jgi:hypothetical protein